VKPGKMQQSLQSKGFVLMLVLVCLVWAEMLRMITSTGSTRSLQTRNLVRRRPAASYGEFVQLSPSPCGLACPAISHYWRMKQ
jgi:hypothetical protein